MALVVGGVVAAAGAVYSANSASSAAGSQISAANAASAQQRADQKPWMDAGKGALDTLTAGLAPGGDLQKPFTMADATNSQAEQHVLQTGLKAVDNSQAAKSGLLNSNAQQASVDYATGVAGTFENQAFNQFLQGRQQQLNANQSLAGLGQSSATNVADNSANLTLAAGNAQAAGTIGSSNAINQGTGQVVGQLSQLFGTQSPNSPYTMSNQMANAPGQATNDPTRGDYVSAVDQGFSVSDARAKTDIKPVGRTDGGARIYTFRMKDGGPVKMGIMAQELRESQPEAVAMRGDGLLMANYSKVR